MTPGGRKFTLAAFAMLVSSLALFTGYIEEGSWIACCSLILGVYASANVAQRKVEK